MKSHTFAMSDYLSVRKQLNLENYAKLHAGEKPFRCGKCDKTFKSSFYCEKHLKRVHSEANDYVNKVENDDCTDR